MQRDKSPHALIVGGGLAGLTAAAYLSKASHRVTLFEKAPSLGGREYPTVRRVRLQSGHSRCLHGWCHE